MLCRLRFSWKAKAEPATTRLLLLAQSATRRRRAGGVRGVSPTAGRSPFVNRAYIDAFFLEED